MTQRRFDVFERNLLQTTQKDFKYQQNQCLEKIDGCWILDILDILDIKGY